MLKEDASSFSIGCIVDTIEHQCDGEETLSCRVYEERAGG